jgi:hypothetical protein
LSSIDTRTKEGQAAFDVIEGFQEDPYAGGQFCKEWNALISRYEKLECDTLERLQKQYYKRDMQWSDQPSIFIMELEKIRKRMKKLGNEIDDSKFMTDIIEKLPKNRDPKSVGPYEMKSYELKEKKKRGTLTIDELTLELELVHKEFQPKMSERKTPGEQAFYAGGKAFKGRCYKCGQIGHPAAKCTDKKNDNGGKKQDYQGGKKKETRKCHHCGKVGHIEKNCWAKHGKPKKGEHANHARDKKHEIQGELAFGAWDTDSLEEYVTADEGSYHGPDENFFDDFDEKTIGEQGCYTVDELPEWELYEITPEDVAASIAATTGMSKERIYRDLIDMENMSIMSAEEEEWLAWRNEEINESSHAGVKDNTEIEDKNGLDVSNPVKENTQTVDSGTIPTEEGTRSDEAEKKDKLEDSSSKTLFADISVYFPTAGIRVNLREIEEEIHHDDQGRKRCDATVGCQEKGSDSRVKTPRRKQLLWRRSRRGKFYTSRGPKSKQGRRRVGLESKRKEVTGWEALQSEDIANVFQHPDADRREVDSTGGGTNRRMGRRTKNDATKRSHQDEGRIAPRNDTHEHQDIRKVGRRGRVQNRRPTASFYAKRSRNIDRRKRKSARQHLSRNGNAKPQNGRINAKWNRADDLRSKNQEERRAINRIPSSTSHANLVGKNVHRKGVVGRTEI